MKYLIVLLALIGSLRVNAQVCKFRVMEDCMIDNTAKKVNLDWKKADFLVVINFDKSKIRLFPDSIYNYDIVKQIKTYKDENQSDCAVYQGVDDDGVICKIEIVIFKETDDNKANPNKATLSIEYSNYSLVYRLKRNE